MSEAGLEPSANIEPSADGQLQVSGELNFKTVSGLVSKSNRLFNSHSDGSSDSNRDLNVDLSGVSRADSAGVALLIEWQRQARQQNRPIFFHNIPSQIMAIARLSGVDELLSLT